MNPFRYILLVLLTFSLGILAYVVLYYAPKQQALHAEYEASVREHQNQQRIDAHQARIQGLKVNANSSELSEIEKQAKEASSERQRKLQEAEERAIIAEGLRREQQAAAAPAAGPAAPSTAPAPSPMSHLIVSGPESGPSPAQASPVATIVAYDADWVTLSLRALPNTGIKVGSRIAIRRGQNILAEAKVEELDPNSGIAKAIVAPLIADSTQYYKHVAGDVIILSPFKSAAELRAEAQAASSNLGQLPPAPSSSGSLTPAVYPDVEAVLQPTAP